MKKRIVFFYFITCSLASFSQRETDVLIIINQKPIFVSEFKKVYEKNLELLNDKNKKNVENYLDLFINFKLKIEEAYALQLDTLKSYKREIVTYKNQLIAPYLQDTSFHAQLVKEAYYRAKHQIKASHILIKLPNNASPKDTLNAYTKIVKARSEIIAGKPFEEVAKQYSEDPSVKSNGGDLGYFTAFKMVYAFENAAYNTRVGETSMPFRTRFGYHIVKVFDFKKSEGELDISHILITDKTAKGKEKIDSLYQQLKNGASFENLVKQFSNDKSSSQNEGKLPRFGVGRMMPIFEDIAFSLKKENEFSKPFQTNFGWHIIKLLKIHPVKPFNEIKEELTNKIKSSGRARLSDVALLNKLKKQYTISINDKAKTIFNKPNVRAYSNDSLQSVLIKINQKEINQIAFKNYIINRRHKPIDVLFELFLEEQILNYFKENLKYTEPTYAATLKEYEEGLLLFELMDQKIWNKSTKDTLGLQRYFDNNKNSYTFKELSKNKGLVMNDYQTFLETEFIKELKSKYSVKIKKKTLKKLVNFYRKNE